MSERFRRVRSIFERAIALEGAAREAWLEETCGEDAELLAAVRTMLAADARDPSFLDGGARAALGQSATSDGDPGPTVGVGESDASGMFEESIGPYRLLERLGEGGMGEVWLAEQTEPVRRRVALKLIKPGMDTRQVVARFEAERQALALMEHPGIARVYDAGATPRGRPYFVMEHVRGVPITEYCDRHKLTNRERLDLFMKVCESVQHAHQKAVIHRDLKPGNVLVSAQDGKPAPKIIDFGVAKATAQKLTERTMHTDLGVVIGTPAYMSPEQADMGQDIDTRTDVYALGVMLYELLVGALPFDKDDYRQGGFEAMVRKIREDDPPTPSTRLSRLGERSIESARRRRTELPALQRELSGDLDWITMKALEKDRTRRYSSPQELAADLERYLTDQPVAARPPSATYRAKKFVRRHTWGVGAAAVGLLALIAFAATMAVQARRIAVERDLARQAQVNLESVVAFQAGMLSATDPKKMGQRLMQDLTEQVVKSRRNTGASESHLTETQASFEALLAGVNTTDLALNLIDEDILAAAVRTIEEKFGDEPLIAAQLRGSIGETYSTLARYERAEPEFEQALALRRRVLGDDHPDTLASVRGLALLNRRLGRHDEAEPLLASVLLGRKRVLGGDHPDTLTSMTDLAQLYWNQARDDEAEPLFVQAIEAQGRVLGRTHPDTLTSMSDLSLLYWGERRFDEAERLRVETLEAQQRLLGDEHPDTLKSINNLIAIYRDQGRYDDAKPLCRKTLDAANKVFGSEHPATLLVVCKMGEIRVLQKRPEEAEQMLAQAVDTATRVLPPGHFVTGTVIRTHGVSLTALGRYPEAEARLLEANAIFNVIAAEGPATQQSIANLVELYEAWGQPAKAAAWQAKLQTRANQVK